MSAWTRFVGVAAVGLLVAVGAGCRQDMHDAPSYSPLEASDFFADGQASRSPVAGTVARGELREDRGLYRGLDADGKLLTELPLPLTRELVARGRERREEAEFSRTTARAQA